MKPIGGPGRPAGSRANRPRQADIARLAGVSQPTVSLILSGGSAAVGIADETRLKVMAAAEQLGYMPDPIAKRLAAGQNNLLGLYTFTATFPTEMSHAYHPFLVGIEQESAAQGYDLLMFIASSITGERPHAEVLNRVRLADGCLFMGRHLPIREMDRLLATDLPVVYLGRHDDFGDRLPYVGADYVTATAEVVRHLAELGHHRILYVRELDDAISAVDREAGFRRGMAECGLPVERSTVVRTDGSDLSADRLRGWYEQGVTAIVTEATDTDAAHRAVLAAASTAGYRFPEDLSLATLGAPEHAVPGPAFLSGFSVPRREMGAAAVRLLTGLIAGEPNLARHQLMSCEPVPGETAGAVR
ncbi:MULTISPECIES: LacI family DNA-binding transcriptional regulator [unclassified Embleya]|uniref:LacI family DNA-binding transcriptional regulator n=1 Tax=unclassified Embleya TaxID=2699296 RepID=UPI0033D0A6BD